VWSWCSSSRLDAYFCWCEEEQGVQGVPGTDFKELQMRTGSPVSMDEQTHSRLTVVLTKPDAQLKRKDGG
jgi:hypothetical protein